MPRNTGGEYRESFNGASLVKIVLARRYSTAKRPLRNIGNPKARSWNSCSRSTFLLDNNHRPADERRDIGKGKRGERQKLTTGEITAYGLTLRASRGSERAAFFLSAPFFFNDPFLGTILAPRNRRSTSLPRFPDIYSASLIIRG